MHQWYNTSLDNKGYEPIATFSLFICSLLRNSQCTLFGPFPHPTYLKMKQAHQAHSGLTVGFSCLLQAISNAPLHSYTQSDSCWGSESLVCCCHLFSENGYELEEEKRNAKKEGLTEKWKYREICGHRTEKRADTRKQVIWNRRESRDM